MAAKQLDRRGVRSMIENVGEPSNVVHSIAGRPEATRINVEVLPPDRGRLALRRRSPNSSDPDDFVVVQSIAFDLPTARELRSALALLISRLEAAE
ncbi:MAG: hypothetical protein ACKVZ0_00095 [Gemmatimonadales bacterium]